jgi:hypothetical protein
VSKPISLYPSVRVDGAGQGVVSQTGGVALAETVRASGLGAGLSAGLGPWRKPLARHDPGKIVTDLALSLALGRDCLADVDRLRSQPGVYGPVASDPTVSRLMKSLTAAAPHKALKGINAARAAARAHAWSLARERSPAHGATARAPLVVDLDATLVTSHSIRKTPPAPTKAATGSPPWPRSWTTAPRAPGSPSRCSCAPAMPGRTPPRTTSPWSGRRWRSCPRDTGPDGR